MRGNFVDATPFSSSMKKNDVGSESDSSSLVDELGSMLTEKGFNYHGVEVLYSGVYGTELTCEIFIGPVYYQRLRHMVSDKFQVSGSLLEHNEYYFSLVLAICCHPYAKYASVCCRSSGETIFLLSK